VQVCDSAMTFVTGGINTTATVAAAAAAVPGTLHSTLQHHYITVIMLGLQYFALGNLVLRAYGFMIIMMIMSSESDILQRHFI